MDIRKTSSFRGGCGFFVQLIIKFRRIYADMNESSGTPRITLERFDLIIYSGVLVYM